MGEPFPCIPDVTLATGVRKLNPDAGDLADTWFFETVVRLQRAGEGALHDRLKPAGRDLGPAIPAADRAIETGNAEALEKMLTTSVQGQLHERFRRVLTTRNHKPSDVKAGYRYVAAHVDFIHFAERVHQAITAGGGHTAAHEH
jgi:hypothetical protein